MGWGLRWAGQRGRAPCLIAMLLPPTPGKCFLYCNGLMDHLYVCQNGNGCTAWYKAHTHFTGTLVRVAGTGGGGGPSLSLRRHWNFC